SPRASRAATLNFFLFELDERTDARDVLPRHDREGRLVLPPRRLDVRYHVCVPGGPEEDAAALLWRVTALFLRHPELPADLVPESLGHLGAGVAFRVAQPDDRARLRDFPG
ncbi:Pvc16 family protein, partial [Deinococcus pimensis]|uniref:Pvc16 family protein n=1 Tax=Deinococcus pimensis TaxID=309888 RepID=UPI0005EB2EA9